MPHRPAAYALTRLLDRNHLRSHRHLPWPRAVSTRDAALDSAHGRVGEQPAAVAGSG